VKNSSSAGSIFYEIIWRKLGFAITARHQITLTPANALMAGTPKNALVPKYIRLKDWSRYYVNWLFIIEMRICPICSAKMIKRSPQLPVLSSRLC